MRADPDLPPVRPARFRRLAVLVAVLAVMLAGCGADPTLAGAVRQPPLDVSGVSLPNAATGGAPASVVPAPDELTLVYFGYTYCPDICPTTLSDISVALADLDAAVAERVTVAMVTVDPERDTDERLVSYLGHFFAEPMALRTTDPEALREAADAFGVQWEVEDHQPGDDRYDVAHTAITYVVDGTGAVVVEWPFGLEADAMASDLTILLTRNPG